MLDRQLFFLALGFYTRLTVPPGQDYSRLPRASLYLPLIGWLTGGVTGVSFFIAHQIWSAPVAIILSLTAGILLTGAFHEDGFADVCDGFGGGYNKEQILAIMKDSRIGVYGALGLVILMSLKVAVLASLPANNLPWIFLAGHSLSRFQPLLVMKFYRYARIESSKGSAATYQPSVLQLLGAGGISVLPLIFLPLICSLAVLGVLCVTWLASRYFHAHIGGYTGDCLGAVQQLSEIVFYMAIGALWIST